MDKALKMKNDNYEEIGKDYILIEVCRLVTKEEREKEFRKELFTKIFLAPVIIPIKIVNLILMLLKNKIKNRSLKRLNPLKNRILEAEKIRVLSSLYGKGGYYYKVIQSGEITKEQSEAINARIKRELKMCWGFHYRKHDKGMSKIGVWFGGTEYKPQWSICLPYK